MFRKTLLLAIGSLFLLTASASGRDTSTVKYAVLIRFSSECCGVPDNQPVYDYVRSFRKKYATKKIAAYRIGPLGREGEYDLAFTLKELSAKKRAAFIAGLKKVIAKLPGQGRAELLENERVSLPGRGSRATVTKQLL
jgi:hypothetical protein